MKLVTKEKFDAALAVVLGEDVVAVIPNRVQRQNTAIHTIFMDELETGPHAAEVAVIRAGARTLQEYGFYKWDLSSVAEEMKP